MSNEIIDLVPEPEQEMEEMMEEMMKELERRREMFPAGPRQVAEVIDLDEEEDEVTERYSYAEPEQVVEETLPSVRQRRNRNYNRPITSPAGRTIMTRRLAAEILNNQ